MFKTLKGCSVLILGGGLQGLSVLHSLNKIGCRSYVYSHEKALRKSRAVFVVVDLAQLSVNSVLKYITDNEISVIIPMGDKLAEWLSRNKNELQSQTNVFCAVEDWEKFEKASSKSELMYLCQKNGITVPKTVALNDGNIEDAAQFVGFPALIKPDHSVGARGITRVDNKNDLHHKLPGILSKYGSCSLQEFVSNTDFYFNVMMYRYRDGSYAPSVIIKILRFYPLSGGSSSLCITIENPTLEKLCKKTLEVIDWHGFADFDVLYDKKTQLYKIIEINPRVPASLRAADVSGINYPQIIVCDALGLDKPGMTYRAGVYLRYFGLDMMWFLKSNKRFKTNPGWFRFFGKDIFYQDLYKDDWKLSVYSLYDGFMKLFRR